MSAIRTSTPEAIAEAGERIRAGRLVAFPTETVYGLGANAFDGDAVAAIYGAKGRPANNPVIVHVGSQADVGELAEWNDAAERLAVAFWPGPLTLVLPKTAAVPSIVTAGGPTVAVRAPRHLVAQLLLSSAGVPIAAPSANRSEGVSPTRAEHVRDSLGEADILILDGGPTDVGLESTVLDVTVSPPRLLRPGMVTPEMIAQVLGMCVAIAPALDEATLRSPGRMPRHYAPRTPLRLSPNIWAEAAAFDGHAAVLAITPPPQAITATVITLPDDPSAYAAKLYDALHRLDAYHADVILVEIVPAGNAWLAIRDRLQRASTSNR